MSFYCRTIVRCYNRGEFDGFSIIFTSMVNWKPWSYLKYMLFTKSTTKFWIRIHNYFQISISLSDYLFGKKNQWKGKAIVSIVWIRYRILDLEFVKWCVVQINELIINMTSVVEYHFRIYKISKKNAFVAFCSFFPCSLTVFHRGRQQKRWGRQWKSSRADKQHCFP